MKLTFDQALDHINDERPISASEVQARALQRYGNSDRTAPDAWARGAITTIERVRLRDIL